MQWLLGTIAAFASPRTMGRGGLLLSRECKYLVTAHLPIHASLPKGSPLAPGPYGEVSYGYVPERSKFTYL